MKNTQVLGYSIPELQTFIYMAKEKNQDKLIVSLHHLKQDRDRLELELHNLRCRYNRLEDIYKNMIEELQRLKE